MVTINEKTGNAQIFIKVNGYAELVEYQTALVNILRHACGSHEAMNDREFPNIIFHVSEFLKAALRGNSNGFSIDAGDDIEPYQSALTEIISKAVGSGDEWNDLQFPVTIYYVTDILKSCLLSGVQLAQETLRRTVVAESGQGVVDMIEDKIDLEESLKC